MGVGIEVPATRGAEPLDRVEVGRRVDAFELRPRRRTGRDLDNCLTDRGLGDALHHRLQPGGAFGMTPTGVVIEEPGVGDQQHRGHDPERRSRAVSIRSR